MTNKVTINKQAIWKAFKEDGKKKEEIRKELYPGISAKNWEKIWEAIGLKGKRPEKAFEFDIADDSASDDIESDTSDERAASGDYPIVENDFE